MSFEIVGGRTLARGAIVEFHDVELADGHGVVHHRDVIRHPGGVAVLPIVDGEVVLVRQYRVALDRPLIEVPAGRLEPGEDPEAAAERELLEELGMEGTLVPLGALHPSPGYTDEIVHLYAAVDIVTSLRTPDGLEEHHAEIVRMPVEEAIALVDAGELTDAKTQIALMRWERNGT